MSKKEFIIHVDTGKHTPKEHHAPRKVEHHAPKPKKKPEEHRIHAWKAFLIILLIIIVAGFLFYFTQIDRSFVSKPHVEKPVINEPVEEYVVEENDLAYMMNEIGAYKLQKIPFSDNIPEIEVIITDTDEVFSMKTVDSELQTEKGSADNPDLRIRAERAVIYEVLQSDNVNQALVLKYEQGQLEIELLKDEKELILKGYKGIYDALDV